MESRPGRNSKAVHRACAKRELMKILLLDDYEQRAVAKVSWHCEQRTGLFICCTSNMEEKAWS
jgi:hypothetical protein